MRGFDFREEDAHARECIQAVQLQSEGHKVNFAEFALDSFNGELASLAEKDQGQVDVFRTGPARFGKLNFLSETEETVCKFGRDRQAEEKAHELWMP